MLLLELNHLHIAQFILWQLGEELIITIIGGLNHVVQNVISHVFKVNAI